MGEHDILEIKGPLFAKSFRCLISVQGEVRGLETRETSPFTTDGEWRFRVTAGIPIDQASASSKAFSP